MFSDSVKKRWLFLHPLPSPNPLPVAGVALAALNYMRHALGLLVGNQGCYNRSNIWIEKFSFLYLIQSEAFLYKTRVDITSHEAERVHQVLVEGNIGAHANDLIFFQCPPHPQDGLCAGGTVNDQFGD